MNRNQHTLETLATRPDIADDPAVARFVGALRTLRRASAHTVAGYLRDIGQFAAFCWPGAALPLAWARADRAVAKDFLHAYARTGAKPASIARKLSALRTFYRFLVREGMAAVSPFATLRPPKRGRALPILLTEAEVTRLLNAPAEALREALAAPTPPDARAMPTSFTVTAPGLPKPAPDPEPEDDGSLESLMRAMGMEPAAAPKPAAPIHAQPKVGRNDPCPCGSGKKYKNCCGR